jgi:hypothetical protein
VRSEYLYRKKLHDKFWYIPPWVDIVAEFIELNRFFFYLLLFFVGDIYMMYRDWITKKKEEMEMKILKDAMSLEEG